jgi:hypothetical protein
MRRAFWIVAAGLLLTGGAIAQSQYFKDVITAAPTATTPCSSSDYVPVIQGGITKKIQCSLLGGTGFTDQSANTVLAGPATGANAFPTFRALVDADIPNNITISGYLPTTGGAMTGALTTVALNMTVAATKTSDATLDASAQMWPCDASSGMVVLTVPAGSGIPYREYDVVKTDPSTNVCRIAMTGSDRLEGASTVDLTLENQVITFRHAGSTKWYIR